MPKSIARRMLKEGGATRISDAAVIEFANVINKFAYSVAKKATRLAAHANRKTVEKDDVELAV